MILRLKYRKIIHAFVMAMAEGLAREIGVYGARGDGKTFGVLGGMVAHAKIHQAHGFPLPVPWIGVTDTFTSHSLKTIRTMEKREWEGMWKVYDGGHVCIAVIDNQEAVKLDLFGIEDQGALERVKMETCGVWFEEPAPSTVMVVSSGVSETAWDMAITSQRVPTHKHVAVMSLNYPSEDHWTWRRFNPLPTYLHQDAEIRHGFHPTDQTRMWFRPKPGERASPEQRAEWANALKDRPDLLQILIEGQPGTVRMGPQVAEGFREDLHVAKERILPFEGEPLIFGQDFGHTPATIIGQPWRGHIRVCAALPCEKGGIKQHIANAIKPWLVSSAPWALQNPRQYIRGCYDISGQTGEQTDIEENPVGTLEKELGGLWYPGPISWDARKNSLLAMMNRHAEPGKLSLQIDPVDGKPLVQALSGRWYYAQDRLGGISRDLPKKPNHPWEDLGDGFCYFLHAILPAEQPKTETKVQTQFDPRTIPVETSFRL